MLTDATGIELIPGNGGNECPGNGRYRDINGILLECCCDECDFMQLCFDKNGNPQAADLCE